MLINGRIWLKCPYYSNQSTDVMQFLLISQWNFWQQLKKPMNPKIHIECQRALSRSNNLRKEKQSWRPHTL